MGSWSCVPSADPAGRSRRSIALGGDRYLARVGSCRVRILARCDWGSDLFRARDVIVFASFSHTVTMEPDPCEIHPSPASSGTTGQASSGVLQRGHLVAQKSQEFAA